MQIKLFKIFVTKVLHLASFLKWEFLELENGLQEMTAIFSVEESYKPHDITHVDSRLKTMCKLESRPPIICNS